MPYPLGGTTLTTAGGIDVRVFPVDQAWAQIDGAPTWGHRLGNNLFGSALRTGALAVMTETLLITTEKMDFTRRWGGIGTTLIGASQGWTVVT